jgi:hypothetical protein
MCYVLAIQNKDKVGESGYWVLLNAINEHINNNDGYALRIDNKLIRTLSFTDFIKAVTKAKEDIENAKLVHLHMRLSTNTICEKFVHLWEFGNYFCSHNGILKNTKDTSENDSFKFFNQIKKALATDNIKAIEQHIQNSFQYGDYGVFILSHKEENKVMLISYGKAIQLYKFGTNFIFSSDALDFSEFKSNLKFEYTETEQTFFGIPFSKTTSLIVVLPIIKAKRVLDAEIENCIMVIDNLERKQFIELKEKEYTATELKDIAKASSFSMRDYDYSGRMC